ncbi:MULTISPECIES: hypothetical protein [Massilia]|uniref:Uncharacterized protein n=2 Tax=Massilia TaxID=149698 RepID=A0ABY4A1V5_9BURK|nr:MULTISPECIES: hypothetical protein [Massilia]NHZ42090.1 hypothetical protein [Massilia aquatica]UOD28155.1 hypothetical protein INH39_22170 [Massilia violaceinigra]
MKALKSPLAVELLADPAARDELRRFLVGKRQGSPATPQSAASGPFQIRRGGSAVTVKVELVPKAKAA